MKWLDGVIDSMGISLCKLREMVKDREVWHAAVHSKESQRVRHHPATEQPHAKSLVGACEILVVTYGM